MVWSHNSEVNGCVWFFFSINSVLFSARFVHHFPFLVKSNVNQSNSGRFQKRRFLSLVPSINGPACICTFWNVFFCGRLLVYLKSSFGCFCIWSNCKWHLLRGISTYLKAWFDFNTEFNIFLFNVLCTVPCVLSTYPDRKRKSTRKKERKNQGKKGIHIWSEPNVA